MVYHRFAIVQLLEVLFAPILPEVRPSCFNALFFFDESDDLA